MSLVEAVEHIRILCHCTSVEALQQLKSEIGDGMVPVKWSGSKAVSGNPDDDWTRTGPDVGYLKTSQFLLVGVGFAPEKPEKKDEHYQLRPLLAERPAVQRLWPLEDKDVHCRKLDLGGGEDEPLRGRSFTKDEMRNAAWEVYRGAPEDPPNMNKAGREICQRLVGANRDAVREILREEEFAKLRRPSGNQPKHGKSMGNPPND
jgi:hypothetical protein